MLKIRKLKESDLQMRVDWMNNPMVYKTMHFIPPISLDNTKKWFERNQNLNSRLDVAFENEEVEIVAMGGLTNIDYVVRKAEFYVFVNPLLQRRGYGVQATKALCKYGFDILQLHKIYLYTNGSNIGARKTYEKVGFKLEGELRDEMISNEKYENRLYYGLLHEELALSDDELRMGGGNFIE